MKKIAVFLLIFATILSACGTNQSAIEENEAIEISEESIKMGEIVYDSDDIVVTYLGIESKPDAIFGSRIEIKFDIENNTDKDIVIQAQGLIVDGVEVDSSLITMNEQIAVNDSGIAILRVTDIFYEGLPNVEEKVDLSLKISDWRDMSDYESIISIEINLK